MKTSKSSSRYLIAALLLCMSFVANADSRVIQVWVCTLNEGKTLDDLHAVHGKWKAWANKQSYGGKIDARLATPIVSDSLGTVLIVDSYPDIKAFAADGMAYAGSKDGRALEAAYNEVSSCTSNTLYAESDS